MNQPFDPNQHKENQQNEDWLANQPNPSEDNPNNQLDNTTNKDPNNAFNDAFNQPPPLNSTNQSHNNSQNQDQFPNQSQDHQHQQSFNLNKPTNQQQDPYAVPKAHITPPPLSVDEQFYVVSKKKFLILLIATLGMYQIYWFWKHWALWKDNNDANIWPIARAIFAIFFTHKLFREINEEAEECSSSNLPNLEMPATIFVVCSVINLLIERVTETTPLILDAFIVTGFLAIDFWTLWQAQEQANIACDDPHGDSNDSLTATNYVFIVLGCIIWLLFIIGVIADLIGFV